MLQMNAQMSNSVQFLVVNIQDIYDRQYFIKYSLLGGRYIYIREYYNKHEAHINLIKIRSLIVPRFYTGANKDRILIRLGPY